MWSLMPRSWLEESLKARQATTFLLALTLLAIWIEQIMTTQVQHVDYAQTLRQAQDLLELLGRAMVVRGQVLFRWSHLPIVRILPMPKVERTNGHAGYQ